MALMALVAPRQMLPPSGPPGTHVSPPLPASATKSWPPGPNASPRGVSKPLARGEKGALFAHDHPAVMPTADPTAPASAAAIATARRYPRIRLALSQAGL